MEGAEFGKQGSAIGWEFATEAVMEGSDAVALNAMARGRSLWRPVVC